MAHSSEKAKKLKRHKNVVYSMQGLAGIIDGRDKVYLFQFPQNRTERHANAAHEVFTAFAKFCNNMSSSSTVCVMATTPDAAHMQPFLALSLKFQLWVAIKKRETVTTKGELPQNHLALLVFTRYHGSLMHTKTRIAYSYCPACGKTTKDYGGKKHVYHEYGTLMSDVWRDITTNGDDFFDLIEDRVSDLFGIDPYNTLESIDLTGCIELNPNALAFVKEQELLFDYMLPSTSQADSRLINDDCLIALNDIASNSIDFCFADPPYNLEKKYEGYNDALELQDYFRWCDRWLSELARVLKQGRSCAVLNIPLWAIRHYQYLMTILNFQNWIVWDAMGLPVRMIMPSHYAILCFSKGKPRPLPGLADSRKSAAEDGSLYPLAENFCVRNTCISKRKMSNLSDRGDLSDLWYDIHRLKHNSRRVDHPCQLPPLLMRRLIALFSLPNEVVLDPFNGVGTTTLAAQQLSRNYIGIELSEQYHNVALQRHNELKYGNDPFGKREGIPNSKNSRVPRLPKQDYKVSKKILQLDVRRIARKLGRLPNRSEVIELSQYPIEYFDDYFVSWGEVCAAARTTGMSELPPDTKKVLDLPLGMDSKDNI